MYEQQKQAGEKSGLVRLASSKLGDLLSNDIDALLAQISSGVIGSIKLEPESIQNILCRGAGAALEAQCRSNAALAEIRERHRNRIEIEEIRHRNREQARQNRAGLTHVINETGPDFLSVAELMAREGTQEEVQSSLHRPPANTTFGEWFEILSVKHKRIVLTEWFENDKQNIISAENMDARYVFDNMSHKELM